MSQDELNPNMMFQTTATELLTRAVNGEIDLNQLAKRELVYRGLDQHGKWVGFQRAKQIHNV